MKVLYCLKKSSKKTKNIISFYIFLSSVLKRDCQNGSLTVASIFSLIKLLKTLIISMFLSFFIVKFMKINVVLCSNVWYNRHRR